MSTSVILWAAGTAFTIVAGLLALILALVALIYKRIEEDRKATDQRVTACQAHHAAAHKDMYEAIEDHNGRLIRVETLLPTNHRPHAASPAE